MTDEWIQDPFAQEWLDKIAKGRTRINYIQHFPLWMNFIQLSPTEQIKRRISHLKNTDPKARVWFEDKVIAFTKMLTTEGYKPKRIDSYKEPILSFFAHHGTKLSFERVEQTASNKIEDKIVNEWIPTQEQIRQIYQKGSVRDRALLLVLYQSGFSEIDVSSLNIQQLPDIHTHEGHYPIRLHLDRTDAFQDTCLSEEAVHDIKAMLRERGNPTGGPLFTNQKGTRLETRFINEIIKSMVTKTYGEEESTKFKTKSLRDAYSGALARAKLTHEIRDTLLGHKRISDKEQHPISQTVVFNAYTKAFRYISVNHGTQARNDIERLEDALILLKKNLDEKDKEIEALKSVIKRIDETLTKQGEETKQQLASIREAFHAFLKKILEPKAIRQPNEKDSKKTPD